MYSGQCCVLACVHALTCSFSPRVQTVRISLINVSSTLSAYFSDSLNHEQSVDDMVDRGELSQNAADRLNEDWESREWKTRMGALPKKVCFALARYHSCTLIMRFYEFICGRLILKVDGNGKGSNNDRAIDVMDKLTRDTYQASLRTSQLLKNQEVLPGKVVANGTEVSTSRELGRRMFSTCLWSNIIPFLAELTVQQSLLLYEYGMYYTNSKKRIKRSSDSDDDKESSANEEAISESAYALTIAIQSTRLSVARGISFVVASFGGAVGTILLPGWGAVFGIQLGDSFVNSLLD